MVIFFSLSEMKTLTNQTPISPKYIFFLESAKTGLTASNWKGSRRDSTSCVSQVHFRHQKKSIMGN